MRRALEGLGDVTLQCPRAQEQVLHTAVHEGAPRHKQAHNNTCIPSFVISFFPYHDVVDMAMAYAISRPFGGRHTPRLCVLTSVARVLHNTH